MTLRAVVINPNIISTDPRLCALEVDVKVKKMAIRANIVIVVILHGRM